MSEEAAVSPLLHALVLAAGESRRFGSAKQLAQIGDRPLLGIVVSRAVALCGPAVTVVLGARAAELAPLMRRTPAAVIVNREWREGLGSSIRAGVAALPGSCEAVLLMLGDQAAVSVEDLRRLADAWRREPGHIAAASHGTTVGAPAIFPRSFFAALTGLRGDRGARALIERHPGRVSRVSMPSAAIDIDTPADLQSIGGSEPCA